MPVLMVTGRKPRVSTADGHGMGTAGKRSPNLDALGLKSETGNVMHENEFNRRVEELLHIELKRCGFDVLKTAPTDADESLTLRAKRSNDFGADFHLDIHANAFNGKWTKDGHGYEVLHSTTPKSIASASILLKHIGKGTPQKNRGVKSGAGFYMLSSAVRAPSVIMEYGFMDDPDEIKLLLSEAYRKECAVETAQAICEIFGMAYTPEKGTASSAPAKPVEKDVVKLAKNPGAFKDIEKTDELNEVVSLLKERGIFGGYEDGTFRGGENITRKQMAVVLYRMLQQIEGGNK